MFCVYYVLYGTRGRTRCIALRDMGSKKIKLKKEKNKENKILALYGIYSTYTVWREEKRCATILPANLRYKNKPSIAAEWERESNQCKKNEAR